MLYSFDDAKAKDRRTTQYFEMATNRAIYHDGWVACSQFGLPWQTGGRGDEYTDTSEVRKTQYFELGANRAIYHDGWVAASRISAPWLATAPNANPLTATNCRLRSLESSTQ